jgi:hypothetical protein
MTRSFYHDQARYTLGTYAGLRAVFVRHYAGNMIEIRVPGGLIVVDRQHFLC